MPGISLKTMVGRRPRARAVGVAALVLGAYALVGGIAQAAGGIDTTPSVYSAVAPFVVFHTQTIAAGATRVGTVSGGTTGVPADATSVVLLISVTGTTSAGSLRVYPQGDAGDGFTAVEWTAGHPASAQAVAGVASNKVVVKNNGGDDITVTLSVSGYYAPAGATGPAGGVLTGTYPNPGLAANSVTAAKISGAGGSVGQVLTNSGAGTTWTTPDYQSALTNTLVVHPIGNGTTDGSNLRAAVNAAFPLVVVEPGTYDLGSTPMTVPSGTSIVGSGPQNTTVLYAGTTTAITTSGTQAITDLKIVYTAGLSDSRVITANAGTLTLRNDDITVQNGLASQTGIAATTTGSILVRNSRISSIASTATTFSQSVLDNGSSGIVTIDGSTITTTSAKSGAPADGVNAFGAIVIRDSTVVTTATNGGQAFGLSAQNSGSLVGSILADDVQVTAATAAVTGAGTGSIKAANSMINGPASGAVKCVASYNGSYNAVGATCT